MERATNIARQMITKLGMSDDLGPIVYGSEHENDEVFLGRSYNQSRNYSEETASKIDTEIKKIVFDAYERAQQILKDNIDKLHFIANYLVGHEIIDDKQFEAIMEGDPTVEDLENMVEQRKKQSRAENDEQRRINEENEKKAFEEAEAKKAEEARMNADDGESGIEAFAKMAREENESDKDETEDK